MNKFLVLALSALMLTQSAYAQPLLNIPKTVVNTVESLDIESSRLVVLKGSIRDTGALRTQLTELDKSVKPITMIINSPGGSVTAGYELITTMEALDSPLTCIVEKEAFSMAALIAAYCPKLYVHKFAMIMFHEASYGVEGNQTRIKTRVDMTERFLGQLLADTASKMNLTFPEFQKRIHDEWWIMSDEAVLNGFADAKLLKLKYKYEEPAFNIFSLFGNLKLTFKIFKDTRG